ncbi:MAG: Zn-ribbon domain-containing OB-fold protein [Candidatus Diapherotrites archaeon]|nr:Zn-ribbon domain-containing OB-fold protein [Candidatus Diapherotrites archaeon]
MPHRKSLASVWRRIPQRYRMESTMCETCGTYFFPPRNFCPTCRRKSKIKHYAAKGTGKVYSYTVIHVPQEGFELEIPYVLAVVELDEGAKLTAQLCDVDLEDLKIGMPVEVTFRRISEGKGGGIIHYAYKFTPISGQNK